MQCLLREKLLAQATKLAGVSSIYRTESHRFVNEYFKWLEDAEKDLTGLRSPISILIQAEKTIVNSVLDGYLPDQVQAGRSIRKQQKATAAISIGRISREIFSKIESIDREFGQLSEKLSQAVAVLITKNPEIKESLQQNQQGANDIWGKLANLPETIPIYNYLSSIRSAADISYLLMDIIGNLLGNNNNR